MKLTILRLTSLSQQDVIDLAKIWPQTEMEPAVLAQQDRCQIYAAKFNDRLLAALLLELDGAQARISRLEVREVTRRRGVGQYLLAETIAQNGAVRDWWIADDGSASQHVRGAFMQACGFYAGENGWVKAQ